MKLILLLVLVVLLGACAPGAYTFTFYAPHPAGSWQRAVVEREVVREIIVEVPAPPIEFPPYPPILPPVEPPAPPVVPPVEPPTPPESGGRIKDMPPQSPWQQLIKRPGEPARLTPRP